MAMPVTPADLARLLHNRFRAQADMFAAVVEHGTIIGMAREIALIEFFRGIVPKRYEVLTGAIAAESEGKLVKASNQLDVLVVDTLEYPTILRTGDLAVALAPSVHVIVEAKSDLQKGEKFEEAMTQIGRAKDCAGTRTFAALFCFGAPTESKTLRGWLDDILDKRRCLLQEANVEKDQGKKEEKLASLSYYSAGNMPDLILSDKGAIAIREDYQEEHTKQARVRYRFYKTSEKSPTVVALASTVLAHISQIRRGNADSERSFKVLIDHFDAGYEKSDEEMLDVTDEQSPDDSGAIHVYHSNQ